MKRGQSATETMMVIVFASALLIPATYLFYTFLSNTSSEIVENHIDSIGDSFVEHVNLIYHYGANARIVIDYTFPAGIENLSVENETLVFKYTVQDGTKYMTFFLGQKTVATFAKEDWYEGKKQFEFKTISGGDAVLIRRV